MFGVLVGLAIGLLPGIGGLTGFALLVPFTYTMDPYAAFAMLLGMASVITTSDVIPAVLFGVPGHAASQATVLDGLPMTKRGEASRALKRVLYILAFRRTDRSTSSWLSPCLWCDLSSSRLLLLRCWR